MAVPFVNDNYRDTEVPINWYPAGDQDFKVVMYGDPGLKTVVTPIAGSQVRAMRSMGDYLYVHSGSNFYQIDQNWTVRLLGSTRSTNGPSWIEQNGVQVAVCGGSNLYVYTVATDTFIMVTGGVGQPPGASCLTYQDGYGAFVDPNSQEFFITDLYDFTTTNLLYAGVVEGFPGKLNAIIMNYRELWLSKDESTEFWFNAGGSSTNPFPFQRIGGPGYVPQGTRAPASMCRYDNGLVFLNRDREVLYFTGYQPLAISTPKMTRELETYSTTDDAVFFQYVISGHPFLVCCFPSANTTWVWDNKVKAWHKRQSWQTGTPLPGRWRGNCAYYWNGMQLIGDYANGKIYHMSPDYVDDDGDYIVRTLYSQEIFNGGKPVTVPGVQILFNHGVAPDGITPYAMLAWSKDGGRTWGNEHWRDAGLIGEYSKRARWLKLGQANQSFVLKLQVSAKCKWDILSVDTVT